MSSCNLLSKKQRVLLYLQLNWSLIILATLIVLFMIIFFQKTNPQNQHMTSEIKIITHQSNPIIKKKSLKIMHKKESNKTAFSEIFIPINYSTPEVINEFLNLHGKSIFSKNGHYFFDPRQRELWVQDDIFHIKHILNIIKELDKPTKQILIETRIVNIVKEASLDLGLRMRNKSGMKYAANANNSLGQFNIDFGDALPNAATMNLAFTKLINNNILDLQLAALEASNKAKIIASPKITTINHQAAIIESGEDIPFQESSNNGGTTTSFKKAVLSLKVTPHILPNKKLLLNLKIQQDIPSNKTINGVPSVITKSMKTHVLLNNGETIILGGIYQINVEDDTEHIPLWGDLPILKQFLNKKHQQKTREQLIIFLTPHIMT